MANDVYDRIDALLARAEIHIAQVFRAAIAGMQNSLDLNVVADLLERGEYQALMDMFEDVSRYLGTATQTVFVQAANESTDYIRDSAHVTIAFDQFNQGAVAVMQATTLRLIREFTDSQREVVREVVTQGIIAGIGPREQARNFRDVVGLTQRQAQAVLNYRAKLETVGNRDVKASIQRLALGLKLRDGRGDAQIKRAIRENTPLAPDRIDWLVQRYHERSVKARAETIARTEALAAVHQADKNAFDQAVAAGRIRPEDIEEEWVSARDTRVRDSHVILNGQKHRFGELWQGLYGVLKFPGDPDSPAAERVNCLTGDAVISTAGLKRVIVRHYSGEIIKIIVAGGVDLTVTPNHPILTQRGWVSACDLVEGDDLLQCQIGGRTLSCQPDIDHGFASAEEVARLAEVAGTVNRTDAARVNLHGEVPDHDVNVISVPRGLFDDSKAVLPERFRHVTLKHTDIATGRLLFKCLTGHLGLRTLSIMGFLIGGASEGLAFVRCQLGHSNFIRFAAGATAQPEVVDTGGDHSPANAKSVSHGDYRQSFAIKVGNVLSDVCASAREIILRFLRFDLVRAFERPIQQAKVAQAAFYENRSAPNGFSHVGNAGPIVKQISNVDMLGDPLIVSVKLVSLDKMFHNGPVYNFETDNGLIVANGIINHNCRCIVVRRIRRIGHNNPPRNAP